MAIRILPDTLVNQIAAGEVIERPAAIVRETVENAIDAGATSIHIRFQDGGLSFLQITDNGHGMDESDLALCVQRHATSKIPDGDLSAIRTMGFRGEALPSIGAIARLTITSRKKDTPHAHSINVEGGLLGTVQPAAHPVGTTVTVRDIFYATPARLKFMKSPAAERQALITAFEHLALANPQIAFTLDQDQRTVLHLPNHSLSQRIKALWPDDTHAHWLAVSTTDDTYALGGLVGAPALTAANAMQQIFIVNKRPVRDRGLSAILRAAFLDVLPRERYPVAVLTIDLPYADVDMNVHPAKAEIRLRHPDRVKALVHRAVKNALQQPLINAAHAVTVSTQAPARTYPSFAPAPITPHLAEASFAAQHSFSHGWQPSANSTPATAPPVQTETPAVSYPLGAAKAQILDTYIIAENDDGLILVDQHAAHERIVYEHMKKALAANIIATQGLLLPEIVDVGLDQPALLEAAPALAKLGLHIEAFGPKAVAIQEVPALLGAQTNLQAMLRDILAVIKSENDPAALLERRLFDVCASMACYGSVRAGRSMNLAEMNALLRQMEETDASGHCNHGRPTFITLDQAALEKLFARR